VHLPRFALDETDGRAARAFNQTSTFGTVLDMVTDRVATSGLLMVLCIVYPDGLLLFQLLLILDIFSHWLQMYAASLTGVTHKVWPQPQRRRPYLGCEKGRPQRQL